MAPLFLKELFFFLPYFLLITSGVVALLLFPTYGFANRLVGYPLVGQAAWYFALSILLFFPLFFLTPQVATHFLVNFEISSFYYFYQSLILLLGFFSFFFYLAPLTLRSFSSFQYEVLFFFFLILFASLILATASDLILIYLAVELQSLALYVLATSKVNSTFSTEAGLKYFVLGSFASSLLLFGIALLYGLFGTTNLLTMSTITLASLPDSLQSAGYLALLLLMVGLFFKVGAAPFHFWVPDVYSGSPLPIFAFFSLLPKVAIWALLLRLIHTAYTFSHSNFVEIFIALAFLSFLVGAYGGVIQVSLRRIFAYSAIGQAGYLILSLAFCSFFSFSTNFLYLATYTFSLLPVLLILFVLSPRGPVFFQFDSIFSLRFIRLYSPVLSTVLLLSLFSIAGVPPFSGFFSKIYLFFAALWEGYLYFTLFSLFVSAASIVYYLRLIRVLSVTRSSKSWIFLEEMGRSSAYFITFLSLANTFFFLLGGDLVNVLNFYSITTSL